MASSNRTARKARREAFSLGKRDGRDQGDQLSSGLTWSPDPHECNEAYDRGVNRGQLLARIFGTKRVTD